MKAYRILGLLVVLAIAMMSTGCFVDYMKITLSWSTSADLDLAVVEPDENLYANPEAFPDALASANGTFGADETDSGTETYTLNLLGHENGDYYAVVLNNEAYAVNCVVEITTGFDTQTYPLTVAAFGNTGVNTPATIKLTDLRSKKR